MTKTRIPKQFLWLYLLFFPIVFSAFTTSFSDDCGKWEIIRKLPVENSNLLIKLDDHDNEFCVERYLIRNETSVIPGSGGYSYQMRSESTGINAEWFPNFGLEKAPILTPLLDLALEVSPIDSSQYESIVIYPEINPRTVTTDALIYAMNVFVIDRIPAGSCIIPKEAILNTIFLTTPRMLKMGEYLFEKKFIEAQQEWDKNSNYFQLFLADSLEETLAECGTDIIVDEIISEAGFIVDFVTWMGPFYWDKLITRQEFEEEIHLGYSPSEPYKQPMNDIEQPSFGSSTLFQGRIHDELDIRFSVIQGNLNSSGVGYNSHSYFSSNTDSAITVGRWLLNPPSEGNWDVYVFVPPGSSTLSAKYSIFHNEQTSHVVLDQSAHQGYWVSLGVFDFKAESDEYLLLSTTTGEPTGTTQVGFDAVGLDWKGELQQGLDFSELLKCLNPLGLIIFWALVAERKYHHVIKN